MPPSNPRPALPFYAPELTPSERKEFDRLRQLNPYDEVALLRILIRRMLHTLNHASTFNETVQSVNALSYLAGRLAKLLESAVQPDPATDLSTSYFLALQEV